MKPSLGCAVLALTAALVSPAAGYEGDATLANFRFASGDSLPELRIHFRSFGRPQRDSVGHVHNAVLILHATTGSGAQFVNPNFANELFGRGQPLDTARTYVILPDGIGHGRS